MKKKTSSPKVKAKVVPANKKRPSPNKSGPTAAAAGCFDGMNVLQYNPQPIEPRFECPWCGRISVGVAEARKHSEMCEKNSPMIALRQTNTALKIELMRGRMTSIESRRASREYRDIADTALRELAVTHAVMQERAAMLAKKFPTLASLIQV